MADQRSHVTAPPPSQHTHAPSPSEGKLPRGRVKDSTHLFWFILLSAALNGAGAMSG